MLASRITTLLAVIGAAVFWLMIAAYFRGGHSADQLIKLGVASVAIWIAFPLACISLCLLAFERSARRNEAIALSIINLAVAASPLVYFL